MGTKPKKAEKDPPPTGYLQVAYSITLLDLSRGGARQTDGGEAGSGARREGRGLVSRGAASPEAPSVQEGWPRRAIPLQGPAPAQPPPNGHVAANHLWCRYIKQKKGGGMEEREREKAILLPMMPSGGMGEEGEKKKKRNKTSCSRFVTSGHGIIAKKKFKKNLSWSVASETAPGFGTLPPLPQDPRLALTGRLLGLPPPHTSGRGGWHPANLCLPFISVNFSLPGCLDEEEEGRKRGGRGLGFLKKIICNCQYLGAIFQNEGAETPKEWTPWRVDGANC